ncbi:MAG: DUF4251 domain-containing protein [Bacteroidales bacterium]
MKTIKTISVSLLWVLGLSLITIGARAQESKLSRQELKEARKAQLAANFNILDSLVNSKSFVLEADFLQNRYGERIVVTPLINFIKVNRTNGTIQTGTNLGMGFNGVGGVTAEGSIGGWKVYKNPRKMTYNVEFTLMTQLGSYDISLMVNADDIATATVTGLGPGMLTWDGHLVTLDNSRVFKGQNTI